MCIISLVQKVNAFSCFAYIFLSIFFFNITNIIIAELVESVLYSVYNFLDFQKKNIFDVPIINAYNIRLGIVLTKFFC